MCKYVYMNELKTQSKTFLRMVSQSDCFDISICANIYSRIRIMYSMCFPCKRCFFPFTQANGIDAMARLPKRYHNKLGNEIFTK